MTFIVTNPSNVIDGGSLELDGADSIASASVGNATYVFVAGGVDDGFSVFQLNPDGSLTNITNVTDNALLELDGATGLSTGVVDGNTYLFAAGKDDSGVSVFRIGLGGALTNVQNVNDDATTSLGGVSDTATVKIGTSTYMFAAGTSEDGIGVFKVAGDGRLTLLANATDTATLKLDGVSGLATTMVGGNAFLIAAGKVDNGISVFSINGAGGLANVSNFSDDGSSNLAGASDVTTAVIGGVTYIFVAGATDNGVSVFSLAANGALSNVANVTDSATTLLAGASSVSVATLGSTTYLTVGGTENGVSLFRVETGGTLTYIDNIADAGSRALGGASTTAAASVNGVSYILGAGASDDGVSVFGSKPSGQLFYFGQSPAQAQLDYVNTDGGNATLLVNGSDNTSLGTAYPERLQLDTAAGFYFALSDNFSSTSVQLIRGSLSGGAATTVISYYGADGNPGNQASDDPIINALQVDAVNHKIYVGTQASSGASPGTTGILQYTYDAATGAVSGGTYLVTVTSAGLPPESGASILNPRDFALDLNTNTLFYTQYLNGGVKSEGLYRLNLSSPNTITQVVAQSQFADNGSNGFMRDVEVDTSTGLLYFDTYSANGASYNAALNKIWVITEGATNGTATAVTLNGMPAGSHFLAGKMAFDQAARQIYVASEENDTGSTVNDDVVYVFQLDAAGTSATLINTYPGSARFTDDFGSFAGLTVNDVPRLTSLTGTSSAALEQAASATAVLNGNPTIADTDNSNLASATVQITGGTFSSNESSTSDDHLGYGAAKQINGTVSGTNITLSWNAATETLTLTGLDTIAHYQSVLGGVVYWSTGDNPTNYGLNTARTLTFTANDSTLSVPGGTQNSATTTLNITAANDAPVNVVPGVGPTLAEDAVAVAITGVQVGDVDTNPALTSITVILSAGHGALTLRTDVAGGLTAGEIVNNGSGVVTITGTINEINATLANATGLTYVPVKDYYGSDTLQLVTSDGVLSDTDSFSITVNAIADIAADTVNLTEDAGATTLNLLANDSFENPARAITAVGAASHGQVTINDNGTSGTADDYVVYTPTADYYGSDSFTYTVTSGGATETATVTVNMSAVADIVADSVTVGAGSTQLNLLANDTFENPGRAIVAVGTAANGQVTISDNNTSDPTDDYVVYTANAGYSGSDSFTYTVRSAGVDETATVSVTVTSTNHAPVVDLNGGSAGTSTSLAYTENGPAVAIAPGATVADVDSANFNGGSLTVAFTANGTTADQLTIQNQGPAAGQIGLNGANVTYGGVTIGTYSGGSNGTALVVSFTSAAATLAAVQALEQHILYANSSDAPSGATRTVTFTAVDGDGTAGGGADTGSATATISVALVDDPATAVADTGAVQENGTTTIAVLSNDSDVDGGAPITVATVNGATLTAGQSTMLASGAIVTLNGDGTLGYNPNHKFDYLVSAATAQQTGASNDAAIDSFGYTINGGSGTTVSVTVNGVDGAGDELRGSSGNNTITASGSNDYVDLSQGGTDSASGNGGDDLFYLGAALTAADHIDGGSGTRDQIALRGDYTGGNALTLGANTIVGIETVAVQPGFDYAITTDNANVASGATLAIYGSELGAGDSLTFNGSAETDGKFMIYGGLGADTITTGGGDDGIYFGRDGRFNPATDHVDGGAGTHDQLALDGSYTLTIARANVVNVESLVLLDGTGSMPATYAITLTDDWTSAGETHSVYGVGVRNAMTIDASAESDGNLLLYGGFGGDTLTGGSGTGTNWFDGGRGADTLTGGDGADTFYYANVGNSIGTSYDRIYNFDPGQDKIDLPFIVSTIDGPVTGNASQSTFDADLAAALSGLGAHHAVEFTATGDLAGHVFEIVDFNGINGYQAGQDLVIELVNQTGHITSTAPFV